MPLGICSLLDSEDNEIFDLDKKHYVSVVIKLRLVRNEMNRRKY